MVIDDSPTLLANVSPSYRSPSYSRRPGRGPAGRPEERPDQLGGDGHRSLAAAAARPALVTAAAAALRAHERDCSWQTRSLQGRTIKTVCRGMWWGGKKTTESKRNGFPCPVLATGGEFRSWQRERERERKQQTGLALRFTCNSRERAKALDTLKKKKRR